MAATTPEELGQLFEKHYNSRDLDAIVDLYVPGGVLVAQGGATVSGADIRAGFEAMFLLPGTMSLEPATAVTVGDIALTHTNWTLESTDDEGNTSRIGGRTAEVCQRQPDGTWKYLIDNPFVTSTVE